MPFSSYCLVKEYNETLDKSATPDAPSFYELSNNTTLNSNNKKIVNTNYTSFTFYTFQTTGYKINDKITLIKEVPKNLVISVHLISILDITEDKKKYIDITGDSLEYDENDNAIIYKMLGLVAPNKLKITFLLLSR